MLLLVAASAAGILGGDAEVSEAICAQTNTVRQTNGLLPLAHSAALTRAAQLHADQMVTHDFFGHTAPPSAPWPTAMDRLIAAGVPAPRTPAENIATWYAMRYQPGDGYRVLDPETFRYRSQGHSLAPHTPDSFAEALVDYWMDSPGHRANILSTTPTRMGCAAAMYMQGRFPMYKAVEVLL
ncbi:MAG: hypothetical protein ACI8RZ_005933 [Myxococcota bacterium]